MIYLCCDTNIWINISNGLEPPRLLNRLYDEMREGNIKLILPEVILKEWKRNKDQHIVEQTQKSTKSQIDSLKKLNEFLERDEFDFSFPFLWEDEVKEDEHEKIGKLQGKINELINGLKSHKSEILNRAKKNVERVEDIFKNPNTIVLPADTISSLTVINLATEKKFPFEYEKNNFADALIFYQFINYMKANGLEKGHFVTSNKKDFFPDKKLHKSFQVEIDATKSFFYKSLAEALNKSLDEELVNLKELKRIEELSEFEMDLDDYYYCLVCSEDAEFVPVLRFSKDIEVVDSRDKRDKNQLDIFVETIVPEDLEQVLETEAESAICSQCGTEHLICPECRDVWDFHKYRINKIQNCENCNLRFIYIEEKDKKGEFVRNLLELLNSYDLCNKCGCEFDSRESGIDICESCNDEYINN